MSLLLGCIADDFTGGTDLAGTLVRSGLRTLQVLGVPSQGVPDDVDAVVVALKSRTAPVDEAVAESRAALAWLRAAGCRQVFFKVCSTFDSTPEGNIGPVADALMEALGAPFAIACPAFPTNGRTVYQGHLFVGQVPLHESGMRQHPLTPMTDANLVRWLTPQTRQQVGLVDARTVRAGPDALRARFAALQAEGTGIAIVDAIDDADLHAIGAAAAALPLLVGGSGLGIGLAANFRAQGLLPQRAENPAWPATATRQAVVAGSCSEATQRQVAALRAVTGAAFQVDPLRLAAGDDVVGEALAWAVPRLGTAPVLVHATAAPDTVRAVQGRLGVAQAGALVEAALAAIAAGLVDAGVSQLVVAGGETSGAVVQKLGVRGLRIGAEIAPGVPWTMAWPEPPGQPLALALKSGNFGGDDFFLTALKARP